MNPGIDRISFYTPHYYLDLKTLAEQRGVDPDKYRLGIGQERMAVPPPDEDIVTLAANAAWPLLSEIDLSSIDCLLFATESGVDQSKAAGLFVHGLLKLPARCRVVELKQACYAGTVALRLAATWVQANWAAPASRPRGRARWPCSSQRGRGCWRSTLKPATTRKM